MHIEALEAVHREQKTSAYTEGNHPGLHAVRARENLQKQQQLVVLPQKVPSTFHRDQLSFNDTLTFERSLHVDPHKKDGEAE